MVWPCFIAQQHGGSAWAATPIPPKARCNSDSADHGLTSDLGQLKLPLMPTGNDVQESAGPKYPNQQLRSVSLETFFSGRLRAMSAIADIQERLRGTYPNLFVPNASLGHAPALQPYQLRDATGRKSVAISVNQASFVIFDYPGHQAFLREALDVLPEVHRAIGVDALDRVVYRYENELGIGRRAPANPVALAFPGVVPTVFAGDPARTRGLNSTAEQTWKEAPWTGASGFQVQTQDIEGTTVLRVVVFGTVEAVDAGRLPEAARKAHEMGVGLFESLISDSFRQFIESDGG